MKNIVAKGLDTKFVKYCFLSVFTCIVLRSATVLWTVVFSVCRQFKSAHSYLSWFLAASSMKFVTPCETSQDRKGCSCHWCTKDSLSLYYETSKKIFSSNTFADDYFIYLCRSLCLSPFFPLEFFFFHLPYLISGYKG